MKKGIADVVTSKKRIQMQSQKLEQSIVKLDTQARQALGQGREDLARTALERKTLAQTELQSLDQQVAELEAQQEQLVTNEQRLRQKIEAFRTKKEVIKAQYSAAEAQVRISEAATGVGEQMADVGLAIQRAEEKTENMRARASAVEELEAAGTFDDLTSLGGGGTDDIDRSSRRSRPARQVDQELAKLRAELGPAPAARRPLRSRRARRPSSPRPRTPDDRPSGPARRSTELPDGDAARLNEIDNETDRRRRGRVTRRASTRDGRGCSRSSRPTAAGWTTTSSCTPT